MLTLYQSNRLSVLKSLLFEILQRHKSANPLDSETILVGNVAIENWLTIALASEFKIMVGINFESPSDFLWQLQQQLGSCAKDNPLDKSSLTWKIISIIDDYIDDDNFIALKQYINYGNHTELRKYQLAQIIAKLFIYFMRDSPDLLTFSIFDYYITYDNLMVLKRYINYGKHTELRKYQLAQSIAKLFVDYINYRPDLLISWQNCDIDNKDKETDSQENMWQPILWRSLKAKIDANNNNLIANILQPERLSTITAAKPKNIFLFGINSLPKPILQAFYVLSETVNIHLFSHNPCSYYWGDNLVNRKKAKNITPINDTSSHVILDTMGKLGRDYFNNLHELEVNIIDAFADDYQHTILSNIQRDIYKLQDSRKTTEKYKFSATDDSLLFHSCHSQLRELQVLHDRLLNWFSKDAKLTPKDILIVAPDINLYTPWIKAVFAKDKHTDITYIPYSVCGVATKHLNNYASTLLKLLRLNTTMCTGEAILKILSVTEVRQKFSISYEDLTIIRYWINKLNICWGLDKNHRHNFLDIANDFNTWEFGIQRLLLGYAIPEADGIYQQILPSELANGRTADLVGKLADFIATLKNIATSCPQQASISSWINWLNNAIENIYLINDDAIEFNIEVATILAKLANNISSSNYTKAIDKDVLNSYLTAELYNDTEKAYIPNGKLTFTNINHVSSGIPFKIVCFLGMNSADFPSYDTPVDFDLKAKNLRAGDELKKDQDKYNFMQLFVSAEQKVHISFIGQSINDNSIKMPSIAIEEIIDYFNLSFDIDKTSKQNPLMFKHALQPFSSKNFQNIASNYFSYATNWQVTNNQQQTDNTNIINLEQATDSLTLKALISCFKNPVKYFYNRCLGIYFEDPEAILANSEPFNIDGLASYQFKQQIIEVLYNNQQINESKNLYKAAGMLPHYVFADCVIDNIVTKLDKILPWMQELNVKLNNNISIDINFAEKSNFSITAEITNFANGNLVFIHPVDKIKGKHIIEAWLAHLCCCTQQPTTTHILCLDERSFLKPVDAPQAVNYLFKLTKIYQQASTTTIPWLPCIGYKIITKIKKDKSKGATIDVNDFVNKQLENYITDTYNDLDVYLARVYPDLNSHHQQFYSLTDSIFSPVLEYFKKAN
jgi:exodeoxyribonuclease V gamma subunit